MHSPQGGGHEQAQADRNVCISGRAVSRAKERRASSATGTSWATRAAAQTPGKDYSYIDELTRLQFELLKMQEWVRLQA